MTPEDPPVPEPAIIEDLDRWLTWLEEQAAPTAIKGLTVLVVVVVAYLALGALVRLFGARRMGSRARHVEITSIPDDSTVDTAVRFWNEVATVLRTRRWRLPRRIQFEVELRRQAIKIGLRSPASVSRRRLINAVQAAWPGSKIEVSSTAQWPTVPSGVPLIGYRLQPDMPNAEPDPSPDPNPLRRVFRQADFLHNTDLCVLQLTAWPSPVQRTQHGGGFAGSVKSFMNQWWHGPDSDQMPNSQVGRSPVRADNDRPRWHVVLNVFAACSDQAGRQFARSLAAEMTGAFSSFRANTGLLSHRILRPDRALGVFPVRDGFEVGSRELAGLAHLPTALRRGDDRRDSDVPAGLRYGRVSEGSERQWKR